MTDGFTRAPQSEADVLHEERSEYAHRTYSYLVRVHDSNAPTAHLPKHSTQVRDFGLHPIDWQIKDDAFAETQSLAIRNDVVERLKAILVTVRSTKI